MRKMRVKVRNATIYLPWGPIKKNLQKHPPPSSEILDLLQVWHLEDIDENNHEYF